MTDGRPLCPNTLSLTPPNQKGNKTYQAVVALSSFHGFAIETIAPAQVVITLKADDFAKAYEKAEIIVATYQTMRDLWWVRIVSLSEA